MKPESGKTILIEAESFSEYGGWVLDQQFMTEMGSPYLMAHGMGCPVRDAATTMEVPAPGVHRIWVRTKDWAASWGATGAPGRFKLVINGSAVPCEFGTEGSEWHWQDGGTVRIDSEQLNLALRDLTGFNGRCDAIALSSDLGFIPPNDTETLESFRRELLGFPTEAEDAGEFDLVVAGGGIAGMCAAISACRLGLNVALVQDRPVFGGNNSSEVRVLLSGKTNIEPYAEIGNLVKTLAQKEASPNIEIEQAWEDERRLAILKAEKNITLLRNYRIVKVECDGKRLGAVIAQDIRSGRRIRLRGQFFSDCTGDGELGALAGADHDITRTGHLGVSNPWHVRDTGKVSPFPRCPWGLPLDDKTFPGRGNHVAQWVQPGLNCLGQWFWECGFSWDPVAETESMRDWNLRAMFAAWDVIKNVDGNYPNHKLEWSSYIIGKRESRRLLGDVILTQEDIVSNRKFPDACFPCTWPLDLHRPHPGYQKGFEGQEFISFAYKPVTFTPPYWAPYRCLYSRNIANLFMAGRNISVTHEALGTVRVMATTGMMGEIVGMAASLCQKHGCTPREVYEVHLEEFEGLLKNGV